MSTMDTHILHTLMTRKQTLCPPTLTTSQVTITPVYFEHKTVV